MTARVRNPAKEECWRRTRAALFRMKLQERTLQIGCVPTCIDYLITNPTMQKIAVLILIKFFSIMKLSSKLILSS